MNMFNTNRQLSIRICLIVVPAFVVYARTARCEPAAEATTGWHLAASVGVVNFVSPNRSAATITDVKTGSALDVLILQRALPWVGIGGRGEFLFVPSREDDASSTFGARILLVLRFIIPISRVELHLGTDVGYSFIGRKVDFENTDHVNFQGATVGLTVGADKALTDRFALGGIARVTQVLGTLACTSDRCFMPSKGRNPGPALSFGLSGNFKL